MSYESAEVNQTSDLFEVPIIDMMHSYINDSTDMVEYVKPNVIKLHLHLDKNMHLGIHRFDCFALNVYGNDKRDTYIEWHSKPYFATKDVEIVQVSNGHRAILNCTVECYPLPQITWLKVCKFGPLKMISHLPSFFVISRMDILLTLRINKNTSWRKMICIYTSQLLQLMTAISTRV